MLLPYAGSNTFFYKAPQFETGHTVQVHITDSQGTSTMVDAVDVGYGKYMWKFGFGDTGKYGVVILVDGVPKLFDVVEYIYGHMKTTFQRI